MKFGLRKPSFWKVIGAYRSQWKRMIMRFFFGGIYGKRGIGWWHDPKKAAYNWWYRRTTFSIDELFGVKPRDKRVGVAFVFILGLLFLPFDILGSVATTATVGHRERKANKASSNSAHKKSEKKKRTDAHQQTNTSRSSGNQEKPKSETSSHNNTQSSVHQTRTKKTEEKKQPPVPLDTIADQQSEEPKNTAPLFLNKEPQGQYSSPIIDLPEEPKEPDEDTPKSKPKHEKDQYIRKRMIIAGSYYFDAAVLDKLTVGTYFEVSLEPDNPYDKEAVVLSLNGEKIGYIAKNDKLAFVTCLRLRRRIYGVITNIITEENKTQYEYETWFDYS